MPGTRYRRSLDVSAGKRRAHVRADVVDRRIFATNVEQGDDRAVDGNSATLSFGNLTDFGNCLKFGHFSLWEEDGTAVGRQQESKIL